MKPDVVAESLKAAPPVAVTALVTTTGFTINEIVAFATLGYISVQVGYLLWKWYREWKQG